MSTKVPYDKRIKEIEEKSHAFSNVREFYIANPYLYRWALKHDVDIKKYFPRKRAHCKFEDRANKGIDCYKTGSNKLYKHYPFIMDALRDLDLTYYYVHKVLNGELSSIEGYTFVRCA
jgi:hypothetical protein